MRGTAEGPEGREQWMSGDRGGEEFKDGKRLQGGLRGACSRKQPRRAEAPGGCTGTGEAGERVQGKKVANKKQ